jgi:hypothetical protein
MSKPKPITLDQVVAASTIPCCGEHHLVVLLRDGRIHLPSHERRERVAEKLAARARIQPENACIAILRRARGGDAVGMPVGLTDAWTAMLRHNRRRPGRGEAKTVIPAPHGTLTLRGRYVTRATRRIRKALDLVTVYKKGDVHAVNARDNDVTEGSMDALKIRCDVKIRRKNKKRIRETTIQVRVPLLTWLRTVWPVTDRGTVAGHLALALLDKRRNGDLVLLLGKPSHGYKIVARGAVVRGGLIKEWI